MTDDHEPDESERPVGVIQAPVDAAEPIREVVDHPACRILSGEVVERIDALSDALQRAEARAERIVEQARREADTIRREAREEGRRDGYEELVDRIAEVRERYRQIQDEAERDTLELAFRIAERIVGRTIELEPEVVREMIAGALEHVRGKRHVVVYLHPDDLQSVAPHREAMADELDGATIYFEEDDRIDRGGCLIETESTRVDARLEMQLERLKDALEGE